MGRIRIQNLDRLDEIKTVASSMREAIFWVCFCILLALASLEAGWIIRDFQKDETRGRILKLETKFTDHDGRIVVLEGPPRKNREIRR